MDRSPLNEQERAARQGLADLLRSVLSGHCSYLEAAPMVLHLRSQVGGVAEFDDDFRAFVGVVSESDHLPTPTTRRLWAEHALKALEPETAILEARAAGFAKASCLALLARFAEKDTDC